MGTFHCKYSTRHRKLFGVELGQRCWHGGVGLSHIIDVGTLYYWILVNRGFYWLCWLLDYQYFVADVGFTLFSWNGCSSHNLHKQLTIFVLLSYAQIIRDAVGKLCLCSCGAHWCARIIRNQQLQRWLAAAEMVGGCRDVLTRQRCTGVQKKTNSKICFQCLCIMNSMFIIFLTANTILSSYIVINMSFGFY